MGFLDQIGQGLRQGGLVMAAGGSDEVFREQGQAIARRKERETKAAEIMLQAAHAGQIPDEHLPELQQSLKRMGYDLPIEALQATPEARQKLSEYARIKSERERAEKDGESLANFGQPEGLGLPEQGLRGNAPAPLPQVPMPPRPQGMPQAAPVASSRAYVDDASSGIKGREIDRTSAYDPNGGGPDGFDTHTIVGNESIRPRATPEQEAEIAAQANQRSDELRKTQFAAMPQEPIAQLPQEVVIGKQEAPRGTIPPIVQDTVTPEALNKAIPPGTSKVDLQEWYKRAFNSARHGVHGADKVLEHVLKLMNPEKTQTHVIDGSLVDNSGRVLYKGSSKDDEEVRKYKALLEAGGIVDPEQQATEFANLAKRKGTGGNTTITFGGLTAGVDANGNPVFAQSSNKGGAQIVEGFKPPPKDAKALTESQGKFTMFYMRAKEAHDAATKIENTNEDVGSVKQSIKDATGAFGNFRTSGEMQKYNTAKKAFINVAVLRADSGANIVQSEYDKYNEIYFPQVGDKPERIAMKQQARQTAVDGLMVGAGEGGQAAAQKAGGTPTAKPAATIKSAPPGKINGEDVPLTIERANKAISGGGNAAGIKNKLLKLGFPKQILDEYLVGPK